MAMNDSSCDILIVGGGTGGCAAAMSACSMGLRVVLTEETDWIGGQLTAQAVPPDEHRWIERFGCTARYRKYRESVRAFYKSYKPLTDGAKQITNLNPGGGWVSQLCHEPHVSVSVLEDMLQPFLEDGSLTVHLHTTAVSARMVGDRVATVTIRSRDSGREATIAAKFVLDATELGDLLPMTGTEYVVGAEPKSETGEPNAVDGAAQPDNVQGITWVFAMAHEEGADHVIDKPDQYEVWRSYRPEFWPGSFLGFTDINPQTGQPRHLPIFGGTPQSWYKGDFGLFSYRQIVDPQKFLPGTVPHPVTIVNWPQNDYFIGSIIDVDPGVSKQRLHDAKQLSLSLLYWLQTEAPRPDGGLGYPGLYMRPDITGTPDGFAKAPYIRESRRIRARFTVCEQDLAAYTNPGRDRGVEYADSVGIGSYRIDLHPSTSGIAYIDTATLPFQIPLRSLIPIRVKNLLPACKNLGVTHITNGCYRLHPVEWNIGESAGLLAAYCIQQGLEFDEFLESPEIIKQFQGLLIAQGIEIAWPANENLSV